MATPRFNPQTNQHDRQQIQARIRALQQRTSEQIHFLC